MQYQVLDIGLTDYKKAYDLQKRYLELVKSKAIEGVLILTEHKPVFTLGRGASLENLLVDEDTAKYRGIEIIYTDRGGDITFHGPGQLVVYPILDLTRHYKDVHRYIRDLEEVTIRVLSEFNITAFRINGRSGAWAEEGKIASIGIGVSRWTSYHGVAINANVDLRYFDMIHPCGIRDAKVTSISAITCSTIDICLLKEKVVRYFSDVFSYSIKSGDIPAFV